MNRKQLVIDTQQLPFGQVYTMTYCAWGEKRVVSHSARPTPQNAIEAAQGYIRYQANDFNAGIRIGLTPHMLFKLKETRT